MQNHIEKQGHNGLHIQSDGKQIILEYETIPQRLRGQFLIDQELKKGNRVFDIHQKPCFATCGPMIDLAMNALMTVDALCDFVHSMAKLGLNMVMLYLEDTFELPGYPKFGYMRGRYTVEELKKVDDYAASLGVEIIPSIQTLGHLARYLPWGEVPSENASVLLPGNEEVYAFIEAQVKVMRQAFRSNRIHIGMDEADGLGHGRSFRENGLRPPLDIFNEHLKRVLAITQSQGYEAMIWADMYFTEHDPQRYYEEDAEIPAHAIQSAPENTELIFWDYYHTYAAYYDKKLKQYRRFPNKLGFAGGVWTWDGYVPNYRYTVDSSIPALECCIDHGIETVIATLWGSQGEAFYSMAAPGMAAFSEYCYRGKACTRADIDAAAEWISGESRERLYAVSDFYNGEIGSVRLGTGLFYCDLLLDTLCKDVDFDSLIAAYERSCAVLAQDPDAPHSAFYQPIFDIVTRKARLMRDLRPAYLRRDRETLRRIALTDIPALQSLYRQFYQAFKSQWAKTNKPYGQEKFAFRFGGIDLRLEEVSQRLLDVAVGRAERIDELDEARVGGINVSWKPAAFYLHI